MTPTIPIFEFFDSFPAVVLIGSKTLPIIVRRMSRSEMQEFEKGWNQFYAPQRGDKVQRSVEEEKVFEADVIAFSERVIRENITLDPGLIKDRGKDITDGEGLISVFHARKDVLSDFLLAVYLKNKLTDVTRKNLNSPQGSDAGSEASIPTRGGDELGSIAVNADNSNTVHPEDATDGKATASSGEQIRGPKVH